MLPSTTHFPHSPHSNSMSSTSGNSTSSAMSGANIRSIHRYSKESSSYRLPSASIFLVRVYRHTSVGRLCFAQLFRVSLSFITTFCIMTSCDHFFRQQRTSFNHKHNRRYGAKGCRSVRLSVGQVLPVSRYPCAHCCCCCSSFSACRGWPVLSNELMLIV